MGISDTKNHTKIDQKMDRPVNHHWMGGDVDDDSDDNESDDDDMHEEVDHDVAIVTDDEYEVSYWNEELVSDAEGCDHGPNCRHVWCEAWEEERDASCIFAEREDLDNLWEKRLSLMWDERLKEEEERRRGDGRWTEEERLNFVWLRHKRRIEFYARAEVAIWYEGGAWAEDLLPEFLSKFNPRELEVLMAARQKYISEQR